MTSHPYTRGSSGDPLPPHPLPQRLTTPTYPTRVTASPASVVSAAALSDRMTRLRDHGFALCPLPSLLGGVDKGAIAVRTLGEVTDTIVIRGPECVSAVRTLATADMTTRTDISNDTSDDTGAVIAALLGVTHLEVEWSDLGDVRVIDRLLAQPPPERDHLGDTVRFHLFADTPGTPPEPRNGQVRGALTTTPTTRSTEQPDAGAGQPTSAPSTSSGRQPQWPTETDLDARWGRSA